jgi:predicted nuclease of predicted toxin-antitoxin system
MSGANDFEVLQKAIHENRLLLTEDKNFGEWVFAHGSVLLGVIFLRYPSFFRQSMSRMACELVNKQGSELIGKFTVVEPGRFRMRRMSK